MRTRTYVETAIDGLVHAVETRTTPDTIIKWNGVTLCQRFYTLDIKPDRHELATEVVGECFVTCMRCAVK
jgi:hypothetical protein